MNAKKLYQHHLQLLMDKHKGKYLSEKQIEQIKYDATINAINEASKN